MARKNFRTMLEKPTERFSVSIYPSMLNMFTEECARLEKDRSIVVRDMIVDWLDEKGVKWVRRKGRSSF